MTRSETINLMTGKGTPIPIAFVLLGLLLTGCVAQPFGQQSFGAFVPAASNEQETFDVQTNTRFPRRHGSHELDAAKQVSPNNFRAGYIDPDTGFSVAYFLTPEKTRRLIRYRGLKDEYINYFADRYIDRQKNLLKSGKYLNLTFYQTHGTFVINTLSGPLTARWILTRDTRPKRPHLPIIVHTLVTGYQGMVLMVVLIYRDQITELARANGPQPPPLDTLLDIHKALAREMLEPARTFLR